MLSGADRRQKELAAIALASFPRYINANCDKIVSCGGISSLVVLLEGSREQKQYTTDALAEIAKEGAQMYQAQLIPLLIGLLSGTDKQKDRAAEALAHMADTSANRIQMVNEGVILILFELLSGTEKQQEHAAKAVIRIADKSFE